MGYTHYSLKMYARILDIHRLLSSVDETFYCSVSTEYFSSLVNEVDQIKGVNIYHMTIILCLHTWMNVCSNSMSKPHVEIYNILCPSH